MKKFLSHVRMQLRLAFRDPAYFFTTLILPASVYCFFAVPESNTAYTAKYLTGSFSAFAFFGVVFLQFAINRSSERTSAWHQHLSTLPVSSWVLLGSRWLTSILLGVLACSLIFLVSLMATPTDMTLGTFATMMLYLGLASLPFLLMGLLVGNSFAPKAVVPVASFFHLFFSYAGGLWMPAEILPDTLQRISEWLPTYHYGNLTWSLASPEIHIEKENIVFLTTFTLAVFVVLLIQNKRPQASTL